MFDDDEKQAEPQGTDYIPNTETFVQKFKYLLANDKDGKFKRTWAAVQKLHLGITAKNFLAKYKSLKGKSLRKLKKEAPSFWRTVLISAMYNAWLQ